MSHAGISKTGWPPHQIFMWCMKKSKLPTFMGIGLGVDYVTWRNIQKCILATSNFLLGRKLNFHSYGYRVTN